MFTRACYHLLGSGFVCKCVLCLIIFGVSRGGGGVPLSSPVPVERCGRQMHHRMHGKTLTSPSLYRFAVFVGLSSLFKRLDSREAHLISLSFALHLLAAVEDSTGRLCAALIVLWFTVACLPTSICSEK